MNGRKFFGGVLVIAVMIGSLIAPCAETSVAPEPGDLRAAGTVDFEVSCAPAVRAEFIRGIALLHSFFYEEARRIFTAVAEKDPTCAMAQWGIATPTDTTLSNQLNAATILEKLWKKTLTILVSPIT